MIATTCNIRPKNNDLEKQQKPLPIICFMLPTREDYVEEGLLFQNIHVPKPKNLEITHANPDHLFLAIAQNWAMRLFVGFMMQGHICNSVN